LSGVQTPEVTAGAPIAARKSEEYRAGDSGWESEGALMGAWIECGGGGCIEERVADAGEEASGAPTMTMQKMAATIANIATAANRALPRGVVKCGLVSVTVGAWMATRSHSDGCRSTSSQLVLYIPMGNAR